MSGSRRVLARFLFAATAAVGLGSAVGCDKKEPAGAVAPPPSGLPPLTEPTPAAAGDRPQHEPRGAADAPALPSGHPAIGAAGGGMAMGGGAGMGAAPTAEATTPGDSIPFDPASVIHGQLKLDGKVKGKVAAGDTIFLVARGAGEGGAPGPVLAVKKMVASTWPLDFELDSRDAMMTGTKLAGKVVVTARVDKDGDAMTKNPGDVSGVTKPLAVPAQKVVLTLDTVL